MSDDLSSGLVHLPNAQNDIRVEYLSALAYLERTHPYDLSCNGKINPYTGVAIDFKHEYDEYLRQHALRLVYEKRFAESEYGNLYLAAKEDFDQQISVLSTEKARLSDVNRAQADEIKRLKNDNDRVYNKCFRATAVAVLLVAVVLFGLFKFLPDAKDASYESGKSDGYDTGYVTGKSQGYSDGYASGVTAGQKSVSGASSNETAAKSFTEFLLTYKGQSQPSSTAPTAPAQSEMNIGQTVYITKNGDKYHSDGCHYLSKSKYAISLDEAKAKNLTACSKCWK